MQWPDQVTAQTEQLSANADNAPSSNTEAEANSQKSEHNLASSDVVMPPQTNIYRQLTGVRGEMSTDEYRQMMSIACENAHGFNKSPPVGRVIQGREIELPVDLVITDPIINFYKIESHVDYRTTNDGVVLADTRNVKRMHNRVKYGEFRIIGSCFGSEYIMQ